ncbi:MAG: ATP-binding protein [Roseiflexaceae bacterium]
MVAFARGTGPLLPVLLASERLVPFLPGDTTTGALPIGTVTTAHSNLPAQLTGLIGRAQEVDAVRSLLLRPDVRLVTLTGPGGIGKTRLAVESALQLQEAFSDGVSFVDLAAVRNPALVLATVAQTLGLINSGGQPLSRYLAAALRDRALLLLLDNFEQVVAAAPAVIELLAACPRLKVLTTSRIVLEVAGEYEWPVPPLALPDRAQLPPFEQLSQYESVRLFGERGRAANQTFAITTSNAPAVAEICHQLDGLPLAIELAAVRVKLFTPQALLARLDRRMTFLTGGRRSPPRQQTIRNTIDWSYQLLTPGEQTVFQQLGVFMGGGTLAAIEAICGSGDLVDTVVNIVAVLVNNSLLHRLPPAPDAADAEADSRFGMLETIREYALEQLAASPNAVAVQRRHAHYYLALAEAVAADWEGPTADTTIAQLDRERDNLRAALQWAHDSGSTTIGLQLAGALTKFWQRRGYLVEGRTWLEELLTSDDDTSDASAMAIRLRALEGAARLAAHQYDFARAKQLFEQSMAVRRALGKPEDKTQLLGTAAIAARVEGQYERAAALLEDAVMRQRALGDRGSLGSGGFGLSIFLLGLVRREQGDFARARALYEESLELHRALGDREGIGVSLLGLGDIARDQGDIAQMRMYGMESLAIVRELQVHWAVGVVLNILALAAYLEGDLPRAFALSSENISTLRAQQADGILAEVLITLGQVVLAQGDALAAYKTVTEALRLASAVGPRLMVAAALEAIAHLIVSQGHTKLATQLLAAASALRIQMGTPVRPVDQPTVERALATARSALGDAAFAAVWAEAQELPLEQLLNAIPSEAAFAALHICKVLAPDLQ